jgi:hypothetical protein
MGQATRAIVSDIAAKVSASVSTPVEIARPVVGQVVKMTAIRILAVCQGRAYGTAP